MRLTTALNAYKQTRHERFPEEARTTAGSFSGHGDRLVHVSRHGTLRDYSVALSGLAGIDRSRLGILTGDETWWFGEMDTIRQHYYRGTRLVETEYDANAFTVHQYDLTLGRQHVTHVTLRGAVPRDARLVCFVTLAPEKREGQIGSLIHEDQGPDDTRVLEVFHRREHDYLTASTGLGTIQGQLPERLGETLDDAAISFPRREPTDRYEQTQLTGDFLVTAPLDRTGRTSSTTLVSQLSDHSEVDRADALADVAACAGAFTSDETLRQAARDRTSVLVAEETPRAETVRTDLRVADLLAAPSGARIAAPEYDPFYANSGGYGYVWFRDEAALSRHLLEACDTLSVSMDAALADSAAFLCDCQLPDGTWPHRVWATDGSVAPGWAHATVEGDDTSPDYQADQTAAVTAFLATLVRKRGDTLDDALVAEIEETMAAAIESLAGDVTSDGLPARCQNVWEDAIGQFTHTAATFVDAFAAVARAPVKAELRDRCLQIADQVLTGMDALWNEERGVYAMRLEDGQPGPRVDSGGLVLARAVAEYDAATDDGVSMARLDRLATHVRNSVDALLRDPPGSGVAGLVRYEGDYWRSDGQPDPKVWSVATGLGALAAARTGALLNDRKRDGDPFLDRASELYASLTPDGPLTTDAGYLAEQAFDDGTLDSATPLGWSHGLRLRATALLDERDALPTKAAESEGPGERPTWTTGEKFGVCTVADHETTDPSRVWFTLTAGALTEARFPQVDTMNLRTVDFLVREVGEGGYAVRTHEEDRRNDDTVERRVEPVADEALLFRHVFTETGDGRGHEWQLTVEYASDPEHDAVIADVAFEATDGREYDVFTVADTALTSASRADRGLTYGTDSYHLVARSPEGYTGETDTPALAGPNGEEYSVAMALAAANRFDWATVGAGGSERLNALFREGALPDRSESVDGENVVLVGRLGSGTRVGEQVALGFARRADTAAAVGEADGALDRGYETVKRAYTDSWRAFLADKPLPDAVADDETLANQYRSALMTLLAVEDKTYRGASIASPSVPWGVAVDATQPKGYGYNFVWARDLYQVFTVFAAVGEIDLAASQLEYVYKYQQDETGFVPQNTYVNGTTRWGGEQMDNISFPQVMAYHLAEAGLTMDDVGYDYENVRRSADYVAYNGPETAQERWEEESGASPSSIAAEIAGLACAARVALEAGREDDALVWLAVADRWANDLEEWTATETGTEIHTETPYYVRIARNGEPDAGHLRTLANDGPTLDEREIIDAGFLELVRLGIRPASDRTVRNSIRAVDETIRVDLGPGPGFYRYNGDGYGERATGDQGAPWSVENHGSGRLWPLLTGERGEYELHRDDPDLSPEACLRTMASVANSGRMISEQVWDRRHTTEYGWEFGKGTGAATPLAWSMAQYVRLAHGIGAGEPIETPAFVHDRYRDRACHRPDRSPALRVNTEFRGNELVVSGETTGARVAVKTPVDGAFCTVEDGTFEVTLDVDRGASQVIVAAAESEDLTDAGTTVWRLQS